MLRWADWHEKYQMQPENKRKTQVSQSPPLGFPKEGLTLSGQIIGKPLDETIQQY